MGQPIYLHSKSAQLSIKSTPAAVITTAIKKDHPLAIPLCLKPASPFTQSSPRTRRKDFKLKTHKKPCAARCFSQNLILPQQPSTISPPCSIDIKLETSNQVPSQFPSTPSEYQAYRAKPDAAPSKATPSLIYPITQKTHSFSSPVINLIPSLPLNLELNRVSPAPSLSSSVPTAAPHPMRSFPPSLVKIRRRISKSDISEARWWVKMYESLVWHMQQQREHQPWSYELITFFTRLENMVQYRWYPIVETARHHSERRSIGDPMRPVQSSGLSEGVPIQTIMTRHNAPHSQSSRSTCQHSQILDPAQLVAQAILRRHQLTGRKPLRRKRTPSPGRSSLGCEITLAA